MGCEVVDVLAQAIYHSCSNYSRTSDLTYLDYQVTEL